MPTLQPLLAALTGAGQLTGTGDFAADLTATGHHAGGTGRHPQGHRQLRARRRAASPASTCSGLFRAASAEDPRRLVGRPGRHAASTSLNGKRHARRRHRQLPRLKMASAGLPSPPRASSTCCARRSLMSASAAGQRPAAAARPVIAKGLWAQAADLSRHSGHPDQPRRRLRAAAGRAGTARQLNGSRQPGHDRHMIRVQQEPFDPGLNSQS